MAEKRELPKHEAVTTGKIEEKSKLQKAVGVLIAEDIDDIQKSIVDDYIRPRFKDFCKESVRKMKEFIVDSITGAAETVFFGKTSRKTGSYKGEKVNYVKYYSGESGYKVSSDRDDNVARDSDVLLKRIVIESYGKAKEVKNELQHDLEHYKAVTVATYYQLTGVPTVKRDYDYGWHKLADIEIIETKGGYILALPKPVPLD